MNDKITEEKEKTVKITESQWKGLMEKIKQLEGGSKIIRPKRVTEHVANLREWEDQLIVGLDKVIAKHDTASGKEVMYCELTTSEGKKLDKVDYLEFLNNANPIRVKIVSQVAHPHEKIIETFHPTSVTNGYILKDQEVQSVVTSVDYVATVEVLDGQFAGKVLELNTKCLNV